MVRIKEKKPNSDREQKTQEVTETSLQRTNIIKRGTTNRTDSDNSDSDIPQIEWTAIDKYIKANPEKVSSTPTDKAALRFISLWDSMWAERPDKLGNKLELQVNSEKISPNSAERELNYDSRNDGTPIVEVDLTADSPAKCKMI